jgi:hypothetical protein
MGTTFADVTLQEQRSPSSVCFDRAQGQVSASSSQSNIRAKANRLAPTWQLCACPFGGGEADHRLSTGQMVVQFLWLTLQEQVIFGIADQRGTTDRFSKPALQVVIQHFGDEFAG